MQKYSRQSQLPYSAELLFELVLDVERYPEFVPGWHAVQILERNGNTLSVAQTFAIGPLTWRFTSHATFERPTRITIESTERYSKRPEVGAFGVGRQGNAFYIGFLDFFRHTSIFETCFALFVQHS